MAAYHARQECPTGRTGNAPLIDGLSPCVMAYGVAPRPRHQSSTRRELCDTGPSPVEATDIAAEPVHARSPPSLRLIRDDKNCPVLLHLSTLWNMIVTLLRRRNTYVRTRSSLGSYAQVAGLSTSVPESCT